MSDALLAFADPLAPGFTGFPSDRDHARGKWADAFKAMIDNIVPAATLQATFATVAREKFYDTVELASGMSPEDAAADLADAWSAAISTFAAGTSLPAFGAWTPGVVGVQYAALALALKALFETPSFVAARQLADIASAFHTATIGLTATTTNGAPLSYT